LKPLPTKEESEREILEEAAKKTNEIRTQRARMDETTRLKRFEERVSFRQELREILEVHGNEAGPEIDKLAQRNGFDADPVRYNRADQIWRFGRSSQEAKVQRVRALDLPEVVILDLLSNDLHTRVRRRNGPRNENEVRVRAAQLLLSYELPGEVSHHRSASAAKPAGNPAPAPARRRNDGTGSPR
jgi:hypothetical protein